MNISVIIPLYNKETRITATIQSVLNQNYDDYEIVVVDDGSTDDSVKTVEAIGDEHIRIIKQANGGPSKARNTGIENAQGEWNLFLDADDELLPGAFEQFITLQQKYPDKKCFAFNFYIAGQGQKRLFYNPSKVRLFRNPIKGWCELTLFPRTGAAFFHKSVLNNHRFENQLRRFEDAEWLFRIMRVETFVRSTEPVLVYQTDSAAASTRRKDISEDFLGHLDFNHKALWEQVALFQFLRNAFKLYPDESQCLYSQINMTTVRKIVIAILSYYCFFIIKKNVLLNKILNK